MADQNQPEQHSLFQSVVLHILPGLLVGGFFFLARQPVMNAGYPPIFALVLAGLFILIPVELGYLLYQGKKRTGRITLQGVISYRDSIPWWQYILWVLVVFLAIGIIFMLFKPVEAFIQEKLFFWLPGVDAGLDGNYSKPALITTYIWFFALIVVLGPLTEELYFRGYLLPRIRGKYAVLLHSFLFAVYHVFTPWMIITRTIGLLPLIYTVRRKNIFIGIIVHILVNSLDGITAIAFIMKMAG